MTFLNSSIVVVVMYLQPRFEREMTVKKLLNVKCSWLKPSGQSVFSFRVQKFSRFFGSSRNCSVVVKVFVTCSIG